MMAAPGLGSPPDRGARGPVIRFRDDGAEIWPSSMPFGVVLLPQRVEVPPTIPRAQRHWRFARRSVRQPPGRPGGTRLLHRSEQYLKSGGSRGSQVHIKTCLGKPRGPGACSEEHPSLGGGQQAAHQRRLQRRPDETRFG